MAEGARGRVEVYLARSWASVVGRQLRGANRKSGSARTLGCSDVLLFCPFSHLWGELRNMLQDGLLAVGAVVLEVKDAAGTSVVLHVAGRALGGRNIEPCLCHVVVCAAGVTHECLVRPECAPACVARPLCGCLVILGRRGVEDAARLGLERSGLAVGAAAGNWLGDGLSDVRAPALRVIAPEAAPRPEVDGGIWKLAEVLDQ